MTTTKKKPLPAKPKPKPAARPHTVTVIEFVEVKGQVRPGEKLIPHDQLMRELGLD